MQALHSAVNLLFRAFSLEISKMSTSGWALTLTIGAGLLVVLFQVRAPFKHGRWRAVMEELSSGRRWWGPAVTIALWVLLFLYSLGEVIFDDHTSLVKRVATLSQDLDRTKNEDKSQLEHTKSEDKSHLTSETGQLQSTITILEKRCAVQEGINQTVQKQNRDQQNTIDGCLSQAMKLLTPEPQRITMLQIATPAPDPKIAPAVTNLLILTNKSVTPLHSVVFCDNAIVDASGSLIGASMMVTGGRRLTSNAFQITIESPPWNPVSPLLVTIHHEKDVGNCYFQLQ